MKNKWGNKLWIGLIMGLLLPVISSFVIVKTRFPKEATYGQFLVILFKLYSIGKLISISVLPNLLLFFLIIKMDYIRAARGVVTATAMYAIGLFILFLMQ